MATPSLPTHISQSTHRHTLFIVILCSVTLTLFTLFSFTPQLAAADNRPNTPTVLGAIAGTVKDINGVPVTDMNVTLWALPFYYSTNFWLSARIVTPEADGSYRFTALMPGVYRVGVNNPVGINNPTARYGASFYPSAPVVQQAQDIPIAGNAVTGIDLTVQPAGQIVVTITTTPEYTLTTSYVDVRQRIEINGATYWDYTQGASVIAGNGVYTITGLAPNIYRACAYGNGVNLSTYECYANVYAVNEATNLTLTAGSTISNVVIVLGDGANFAQIKGQVTALDGKPIADIRVYALPLPAEGSPIVAANRNGLSQAQFPFTPQESADDYYGYLFADTDATGNYQLSTLPAGDYRLQFVDPSGGYAFEYYHNTLFVDSAAALEVTAQQVISAVNAQLDPGARISGKVTLQGQPSPETNVLAEIKRADGSWLAVAQVKTNPNTGHYRFKGLPAAVYRISAQAQLSWYDFSLPPFGVYGGTNLAEATEIGVNVGSAIENIDVILNGLRFEGTISGRVTANGVPLPGAKVSLYNRNALCCDSQTASPIYYLQSDAEGRYTINGLTNNEFILGVSDPAGVWATTYYSGSVVGFNASPITVHDTQAVTKIDVDLPLAGAISGVVRRSDATPLAGLRVLLYWRNRTTGFPSALAQESRTDATGHYRVAGLHPGDYHVCFTLDSFYGNYYSSECYGTLGDAIYHDLYRVPVVSVAAGKTTEHIDLHWGAEPRTYLPLVAQ